MVEEEVIGLLRIPLQEDRAYDAADVYHLANVYTATELPS